MSENIIQIRQAQPGDAPFLLATLHAAFDEYRYRLVPPSSVHAETIPTATNRKETLNVL